MVGGDVGRLFDCSLVLARSGALAGRVVPAEERLEDARTIRILQREVVIPIPRAYGKAVAS